MDVSGDAGTCRRSNFGLRELAELAYCRHHLRNLLETRDVHVILQLDVILARLFTLELLGRGLRLMLISGSWLSALNSLRNV